MSRSDLVLVTGGTGTAGRAVVDRLRADGMAVAVLSRRDGPPPDGVERRVGDLRTGAGIASALRDVGSVVHLASNPLRARRVDVDGTDRLVEAALAAGVRHLVYLSIVGCDRNPYPYYRSKARAEAIVLDGRLPAVVLRATQFHDFVPLLSVMLGRWPVLVVPRGLRAQLVDVHDVADRISGLVASGRVGRAPDLAGPHVIDLPEAIERWARVTGRRRPRIIWLPALGKTLRAFAAGTNLPDQSADVGERTFEEWLAQQPRAARR